MDEHHRLVALAAVTGGGAEGQHGLGHGHQGVGSIGGPALLRSIGCLTTSCEGSGSATDAMVSSAEESVEV